MPEAPAGTYKVKMIWVVTDPTGFEMNGGENWYAGLSYENLVMVQDAVTNALLNLGKEKIKRGAEKK